MINVPDVTSVNNREYIPSKGTIAFAPELVDFIKCGEKQSTYRYGLKYDYIKVGDVIDIVNSSTEKVEASVKIVAKNQLTLADLPLGFDKHEVYRDKEHQRQVLGGYYAYIGREIRDDDLFLVFEFELMNSNNF